MIAICDQIIAQFEAERAALADPAAAQRVIDDLNAAKAAGRARSSPAAAKWSQTLTDGVADLSSDIDHDLRGPDPGGAAGGRRLAWTNVDPADTWPQMESWLQSRVSYELLANYTLLRERADALSEDVGEHFREASGEIFDQLAVYNPTPLVSGHPGRAQDRAGEDEGRQAGHGRAQERVRRRAHVHHARQR